MLMPLFTMSKKSSTNDFQNKDDKLIKEEIKPQITVEFISIDKDYAILGENNKMFYFKLFCKDIKPLTYKVFTYTPTIEVFENRILLEMFSLKNLLEELKRQGKKSIIVYSNIDDSKINNDYSQIKDCSSMFRYKAKEIINLINDYKIEIIFENIDKEENHKIKEMIENENEIQWY